MFVDLQVGTNVLEKHTISIFRVEDFSPEDGDNTDNKVSTVFYTQR
jgi:hypothetical protein